MSFDEILDLTEAERSVSFIISFKIRQLRNLTKIGVYCLRRFSGMLERNHVSTLHETSVERVAR